MSKASSQLVNVTVAGRTQHYRSVAFDAEQNAVLLIDQRLLPHRFNILHTRNYRETALAIANMAVRGAPAIAAAAAYGLAQAARAFRGSNLQKFTMHIEPAFETLKSARPTAVDPLNAMLAVKQAMQTGETVAEKQVLALAAAEEFANKSVEQCRAIGRHGLALIRDGMRILTHCNAGWLACVDVGTATAPMYAAHAAGRRFHVFCSETRPRAQGASLTAWELAQQGISHQVIADSAAGYLMQRGEIDLVIVGSDRVIARTGEIINKIGTYTKAVLAWRHRIPFYVAVPLSTFDWQLKSAREITIEQRDEAEVLGAWGVPWNARRGKPSSQTGHVYVRVANPSSGAVNPAFDVTPPELVTGIITPLGIFRPAELWRRRKEILQRT